MPAINDFSCPGCDQSMVNVFVPTSGARPVCACGCLMEWQPGSRIGVDLLAPFEIEVNGATYHVDSVHTLRQIERRAEQQYRNGEGQPYIVRDFSQNQSNRDVNVFGEHRHPKFSTRNRRGIPYITRKGLLRDREDHG